MFCPYCLKRTKVFHVKSTRWNSSNFDRHLDLKHFEIPENVIEIPHNAIYVDASDVILISQDENHKIQIDAIDESDDIRIPDCKTLQEATTTVCILIRYRVGF